MSSKSSSKQSQSTSQADKRIVGGDDSVNTSGDASKVLSAGSGLLLEGSGNILSSLDGGAIKSAFDFAAGAIKQQGDATKDLFAAGRSLLDTVAESSDRNLSAGRSLLETAATSADQSNILKQTQFLMLAGLAVLALLQFGKGKVMA